MLRLENLTTGFESGHKRVVSAGLAAQLPPASLACLIGRNGTGKTTLMRTIAGLLPPIGGGISWQSEPLPLGSPKAMAALCSVVLTRRVASAMLTVAETVAMGRMPHTGLLGILSPSDKARVDECMKLTGVDGMSGRTIGSLSDGEYQRVMIAKALAQSTPLILLDEPTAFLDFPAKVETLRLLLSLAHSEGRTILISTHDIELSLRFADSLWVLTPGGLASGTVAQMAASGAIAQAFDDKGISFDKTALRFEYSF